MRMKKSSYTDLSHDTKRKSITKMDMKETFGLPNRNIIFSMFTSETIGRLFVEMSLMENVEIERCNIALDYDIYPTLVVVTDRNKTCELHGGNIISTAC